MNSFFLKITSKFPKIRRKLTSVIKLQFVNTVHISIGENCLTDNILQRHNLKSLTTPYSHGRSNLDYAIILEKENYSSLLKPDYLKYEKLNNTTVVRNNNVFSSDPIFSELHRNGFEFTHHDVISNKSHRESLKRKIDRLKSLKGKKHFIFYYHYRVNPNLNLPLLIAKAKIFLAYYQKNRKSCRMVIFTQELCDSDADRGYRINVHSKYIQVIIFKTMQLWEGDDQDVFWARIDDDLIKMAFTEVHTKGITEQGAAANP